MREERDTRENQDRRPDCSDGPNASVTPSTHHNIRGRGIDLQDAAHQRRTAGATLEDAARVLPTIVERRSRRR